MLGKLIEKVIGKRMQYHAIANNFVHPNQLGGLKQQSTFNVDNFLTHLICLSWIKNIQISTLAFDVA